ncbi:glycosyltransferase [Vibrio sp. E150_011]
MNDLIVFGEDYGALPSSTQHLISRIANTRQVLWVNSIGLRQPRFNKADLTRVGQKLLGRGKSAQVGMQSSDIPSSIQVINVRTIPAPSSKFGRIVAAVLTRAQIKPWIRKLNLNAPILWTSLPTVADLCGTLGESSVVYYCGDDFSALAGVDHHTVREHERRLVEQADMILTASEKLQHKFPADKQRLLTHGVDCQLFSSPSIRANDLPDGDRPIAGFYGSLSSWLDYELLNQVIVEMPDWDFVFIGPNEMKSNPLIKADNVFVLGARPHSELPSYSQHWTVSLLPFLNNSQIKACNPLKLKEYLAARRPIVTTEFPALDPYRTHINIVEDKTSLISTLRQLEAHPDLLPEGIVDNESWDNRVVTLERYLESL